MKITVYTISDCQFSKQEKEYLTAHNLQYEEKSLETNKDFLTEMLAISNNFAGTPVTRVEKDDGSIAVLKGFTKEEFDTTFGFATETKPVEEPAKVTETSTPTPQPVSAEASTGKPAVVEPPKEEPKSDELNAVIDKLEQKTAPETTSPSQPIQPKTDLTDSTVPPANAPVIPDFPADGKTSV